MFADLLNFRTYVVVGIGTTLVLYLVNFLAGPGILNVLNDIQQRALQAGISSGIASFVMEPLKFIFQPDSLAGPALAGLLWPLGFLWLMLMILMIVFAVITPALNQAADPIRV